MEIRQLTGRGAGRSIPLAGLGAGAEVRVGRDEAADFVIDEEHVSSAHLLLRVMADGVEAEDLRSTNGTIVQRRKERLRLDDARGRRIRLADGDVIYLGDEAQPVHLRVLGAAGELDATSTRQEVLAVAHLEGVPSYEQRIRNDPKRISQLYDLTKRLAALLEPAEVGTAACTAVFELFDNATHVVISLEESPGGDFIHFLGRERDGALIERQDVSSSVLEQVRSQNAGVLLADAANEESPARSIVRLGIRTVIAAPMLVGDRVTGVLQVDSRERGRMFNEYDLQTLTVLASQVGLAVQNARLVARLTAAEARLKEENTFLKTKDRSGRDIIGDSAPMRRVFDLIDKVCQTRVPVAIEGETGTGKELVARAIHYRSDRADKLFVTQNCAAIPESILESELFGHMRGSFTSANRDKKGLFEIADGGTIFLDEIGETTPGMQAKLLRVLQEGEVRPVGATRPKIVNVRVVSATNRNLEEEVAQGRFREDLYYRLKVFPIKLPPLRDRREDIPLLARHFLAVYCREAGLQAPTFSPEALALLMAYRWPGNVRELQNEQGGAVSS
jgi:transcriptional regulator with GAF, ATPase, and Fis domain